MRYYDSLGAAGYPISGGVSYEESWQEHLDRGSSGGLDYGVGVGRPIYAPTRGRVLNRYTTGGGNTARFYHIGDDGNETGWFDEFLHLSEFGPDGGIFEPGEDIGARSGNSGTMTTGPHVHWHLVIDGTRVQQWLYFQDNPTPIPHEKDITKMNMCHIPQPDGTAKYLLFSGDFYLEFTGQSAANAFASQIGGNSAGVSQSFFDLVKKQVAINQAK
jgi:murein DD-endopeptidase MepM/ murein hydrolase activator NlpD